MKSSKSTDSLLVLLFGTVLVWPLFRLKYMDNWPSIESTFISDARMLSEHLPHPGWQPLWYCGTRFDYIYPPALRYGTALTAKLGNMTDARAYHLYTAVFYVLGLLAVYWLVRRGTGSRGAAALATGATALLSPSFLLLPEIRHDSAYWVPQRLHALMSYGEGPHITALGIIGAALAASWAALRRWNPGALAVAGLLCALAVANNFYGATSLAVFFPLLAWAAWVGERNWRVWACAAGLVALAFGWSAFWLTPSYVKITIVNLAWVSQPGKTWSEVLLAVVAVVYAGVSFRWGNRKPERAWGVFVWGSATFLSLDVLGYYYFGFRVAGEPPRLIPELDLALILAATEAARAGWARPRWRPAVAALVLLAFLPAGRYLRHAWSPFVKAGAVESVFEYRVAQWVHQNLAGERVMPTGTVRFWFDAWADNAQPDGGSMQGMLNQKLPMALWQILHGPTAEASLLWLRAMGTDAIVVPEANSAEYYHDFEHPEKFRGNAPVLYDDGHGTLIYRVPRALPGIGRVVNEKAITAVGPIGGGDDTASLTRYLAVVDASEQARTRVEWRGFDEASVEAETGPGMAVLLQETYDAAWRAEESGKRLTIRREPTMGFMLIEAPPGHHAIRMHFDVPGENRAGQAVLGVAVVVTFLLLASGFNAGRAGPAFREISSQS